TVAAVRTVVVERQRIDEADARKREPRLLLEILDLFRGAERERVVSAREEPCVEQARDVARRHRSVCVPHAIDDYLDERLEPVEAARAVAHDLDRDAAALGLGRDGCGDGVGAERARRGVGRNEYFACRAHARISSSRSGVTRPYTVSSTMTVGEHAQLPRQ